MTCPHCHRTLYSRRLRCEHCGETLPAEYLIPDPQEEARHWALLNQSRMRGAIDHYYASPVAADGKVFLVSQTGVITVLKAEGTPEVLTTHELDDEAYATPAIADGRIYIRTRSALYCFGK